MKDLFHCILTQAAKSYVHNSIHIDICLLITMDVFNLYTKLLVNSHVTHVAKIYVSY